MASRLPAEFELLVRLVGVQQPNLERILLSGTPTDCCDTTARDAQSAYEGGRRPGPFRPLEGVEQAMTPGPSGPDALTDRARGRPDRRH